MLHIEVIHSNADEPYRLEDTNGAEFVLKVEIGRASCRERV